MLRVRVGRKQPEARKLAEAIEAPLAWANTRELRRPSLIDHGLAEYVEDEPLPPITVPAAVWQGLEAVKDSGATNMLDRPVVIKVAEMRIARRRRDGSKAITGNVPKDCSGDSWPSPKEASGVWAGRHRPG